MFRNSFQSKKRKKRFQSGQEKYRSHNSKRRKKFSPSESRKIGSSLERIAGKKAADKSSQPDRKISDNFKRRIPAS